MDQRLLAVRQRLRDDFPYYAEHALKIRTKKGEIAPLVLNKAQHILHDAINKQVATTGRIRIIVLKGRQQGLSTEIGGYIYFYVSQHAAQRAIVATHLADSTRALFDMTRRYFDNTPPILKPSTRYASRRELYFDKLDSSYIVGTAGSESIGRGETITHCHASELAFWPASSAKETFNGLMQAIPDAPGTALFVESTANGVSGLFYELWQGAVKGENGFVAVFIPWFLEDGYRAEPPANFGRSPMEQELVDKYGLDDAQLYWRRLKVAQNGIDLFKQEYPCNADEAFLTSGRPVFIPEQLVKKIDTALPVLRRLALEGAEFKELEWKEHPRGELLVYREHDPEEVYTIGADVGMGVKDGDYSVAHVLDKEKRQVATYRALAHPDHFAEVLYKLGEFYNMALIAPENNNHGILTVTRLAKDLVYPYVYTEVVVNKTTDEETVKLGFGTNVKTKPLIIDKLRASARDNEIELNDLPTIREMLTYIVTESGAMEAEKGNHDDCVMALAIANHVHEGNYKPIENEEDFYEEAI